MHEVTCCGTSFLLISFSSRKIFPLRQIQICFQRLWEADSSGLGYLSWLIKLSYFQTIALWQHLRTLKTALFGLGSRSRHGLAKLEVPCAGSYYLPYLQLITVIPPQISALAKWLFDKCIIWCCLKSVSVVSIIQGQNMKSSFMHEEISHKKKITVKSISPTLSLPSSPVFMAFRFWTCFSWVACINTSLTDQLGWQEKSKRMSENSSIILFPAGELFFYLVRVTETRYGSQKTCYTDGSYFWD